MNYPEKTKEELTADFTELQKSYHTLKTSYHNDIAKHELVEQELIEAKILTNNIVDSTSDLIWSVDSKNFGLLSFNKAFSDFFLNEAGIEVKHGYNQIGSHPLNKYTSIWKEMYTQVLKNGPFTKEYHLFTGNHILELSFNLLKRDNEIFGISVFGKDITQRRRIEENLSVSNEKLQGIFNNLQDAFFESDQDGKLTTISPSALPMFGYKSIDEMLGMQTVNLYADLNDRDRMLSLLFEKGKLLDFTGLGKRKDGTTFWSSLNVQIIYNQAGDFSGTMGVVRDISERILTEEELKNSEAKYRNIYDNAIEGMFRTSMDGQFLQCNKALAKLLGYASPEEIINRVDSSHDVWVDPNERIRYTTILDELNSPSEFESQFKRTDQTVIWVSINGKLVRDEKGNKLYYEGFVTDITLRKNNEIELEKKLADLQWHYNIAIDRELKMIELKEEINSLLMKSGEKPKYNIKK